MKNFIRELDGALPLIVVTVAFLALVGLKVTDYVSKDKCITNGYPTYTRVWTKQYCSKVVNGTSVLVKLSEVK